MVRRQPGVGRGAAKTTVLPTVPRFAFPHADQRECSLYYIDVLDVTTNYTTVTLGYVGETARLPFVRFLEHLYDQPFGDLIVGKPRIDPRMFAGKAAVLAAERAAVEGLRPQYNDRFNRGNFRRIPVWLACQQRAARDRARGVPGRDWARGVPGRDWARGVPARDWAARREPRGGSLRGRRSPVRGRGVRPGRSRRLTVSHRWRRRLVRAAQAVGGWLVLALGLWWLLAVLVPAAWGIPERLFPIGAAGLAALPFVTALPKRRQPTTLALVAVAVAVLVTITVRTG
jgi:hypothetical protein